MILLLSFDQEGNGENTAYGEEKGFLYKLHILTFIKLSIVY